MYSGKTTSIIKHIRFYRSIGVEVMIIKPSIDVRYSETHICSHNQEMESCHMVSQLDSVMLTDEFKQAKVIIIEEGQFFESLYQPVLEMLDHHQKHIIISALNGDSNRRLFGEIHLLLPICTQIEWLHAICKCKEPACYSKRKSNSIEQIEIGNEYEAVCFQHYFFQ
jgi:thymidine kinase